MRERANDISKDLRDRYRGYDAIGPKKLRMKLIGGKRTADHAQKYRERTSRGMIHDGTGWPIAHRPENHLECADRRGGDQHRGNGWRWSGRGLDVGQHSEMERGQRGGCADRNSRCGDRYCHAQLRSCAISRASSRRIRVSPDFWKRSPTNLIDRCEASCG